MKDNNKKQFGAVLGNTTDDSIHLIGEVNTEKNYWIVRSMGGNFFDEFYEDGFIAIGYNYINDKIVRSLDRNVDRAKVELKSYVYSKYPNLTPRKIINIVSLVLKFYFEIKEGDIILIPNTKTKEIAFGQIISNLYTDESEKKDTVCHFEKRRKVKWIKKLPRQRINPRLMMAFNSQHTISSLKDYSEYIDNSINDFYSKGEQTFLVLRVKQKNSLSLQDFTFISDLVDIFKDINDEQKIGLDIRDVKIKTSVESPGDIVLYSIAISGVIILMGLLVTLIKGGNFEINMFEKIKFKASIPGTKTNLTDFIKAFSKYKDNNMRREKISKMADKLINMEVETPEDIVTNINRLSNLLEISSDDSPKDDNV